MKNFIPQCNPKAGYDAQRSEINSAIASVLNSGQYILGKEVNLFEKEFSAFLGTKYCIGVGNGTDAIEMALRASGAGPGDVVFTTSNTAVATVAAIERAGATPFLVEIDEKSYTMDPNHLENAVKMVIQGGMGPGYAARAVIPVHLYGHPADMPSIMEISDRNGLVVIEDCAQAHGASFNGKNMGTWGKMGTFSFYPTKNLGALGDGGAVVTDDLSVAETLSGLREYGWKNRGVSAFPGINSRLDEIQAAVLRVKLKSLWKNNQKRILIAEHYREEIDGNSFQLPQASFPHICHVYHQFVIQSDQRDLLLQFLSRKDIGTAIHYPEPIHLQPAYRDRLGQDPEGLPISETICKKILSLPMYPEMSSKDIERVCKTMNSFIPHQIE